MQVDSYNDPSLTERLLEAKVSLPNIVKPQVACGVSSAHSMVISYVYLILFSIQLTQCTIRKKVVCNPKLLANNCYNIYANFAGNCLLFRRL